MPQQDLIQSNKFFIPYDFFVLRVPLYSLNCLNNIELNDMLEIFEKDTFFQECILIANPEFYKLVHNKIDTGIDKNISQTLMNYYKRLCSRTIPFGLFAGIEIGTFGNETDIGDISHINKRCRVNNEWILKYIKILEKNKNIIRNLNLMTNELIYRTGNEINLYHSINEKLRDGLRTQVSITLTNPIEKILDLAKNKIIYEKLAKIIISEYGGCYTKEIYSLINSLIEHGFLITELRRPLVQLNYLDEIIKVIEGIEGTRKEVDDLKSINIKISNYNKNIGNSIDLLNEINDYMDRILKTDNKIHVDCKLNLESIILNKNIAYDVAEAYSVYCVICGEDNENKLYNSYVDKFIEKYGENVEVPLIDVFSREIGIGKIDYSNNINDISNKSKIRKNILLNEILDCVKNNVLEIDLGELIGKYKESLMDKNNGQVPKYLEVFGEIIVKNKQKINKDNYIFISSKTVNTEFGASYGRFLDILDKTAIKRIKKHFEEEEDVVYVQLLFIPDTYSFGNVVMVPKFTDYAITLNSYQSDLFNIPLNDLMLYAYNGELNLKSKMLDKRIEIFTGNMFNPFAASSIYEYLTLINCSNRRWNGNIWGELSDCRFLPRIRYKNIVLSPAQWSFNIFNVEDKILCDSKKWSIYFNECKILYNIPKYTYCVRDDKKLITDTENEKEIEGIRIQLKSLKLIILIEVYGDLENRLIMGEKGLHFSEVVIPLKYNQKFNNKDSGKYYSSNEYNLPYAPIENYLFIKIYSSFEQLNNILIGYIFPFSQDLVNKKIIKEWFFVRYKDIKNHLRIRFKGDTFILLNSVIPEIHKLFKKLLDDRLSDNMTIEPYIQESHRYGGIKSYNIIETFFYIDSVTVIELILNIKNKKIPYSKEVVALYSIIYLFRQMEFSYDKCIKLIDINCKQNIGKDLYRKNRKIIIDICSPKNQENFMILKSIMQKRNDICYKIYSEIYSGINDEIYLYSIMNSLIHMHLNRWQGKRDFETNVRELLRCYLRDLLYWRNDQW